MTTTEKLLIELNAARGVAYPDPGYTYFADVRGDGRNIKSVWAILASGGVTRSDLDAATPRQRCDKIRDAIAKEKHGVTLAKNADRPWFPA